jgi:DNA mismatch endonuclease (patch repair protein)
VERDKEVNNALTQEGWLVLRFWESEIQMDLERCVESVVDYAPARIFQKHKIEHRSRNT